MHDGMRADYQIIQGDCIERLKELPSESVHCVVTSPPYFGLRDYGTAQWEGGSADCDHKNSMPKANDREFANGRGEVGEEYSGKSLTSWTHRDSSVGEGQTCRKCGAVRIDSQIGLEASPQLFIAKMVEVFEEVRRVLRSDGVLFLNLGDSYWGGKGQSGGPDPERQQLRNENGQSLNKAHHQLTGSKITRPTDMKSDIFKPKDLMLIPHRVVIALQDAGWYVRSDMPWVKRSAMPESVTDRPAKALEYVFLLTKSKDYFFDMEAVRVKSNWDASKTKFPDGWDTGEGGHGSFHREGREKGKKNNATQSNRDRSLPSNRNGITGSLDETPAGGRNFRNSDLWFSSVREPHGLVSIGDELVGLDVNPSGFKDAHFATFPPKLIEPLIKAGTSEKGCCVACGAPWERVVEKTGGTIGKGWHDHKDDLGRGHRGGDNGNIAADAWSKGDYTIETLGWQKTCECTTDETRPCTVLDPFAGAGTTLLVSKRLGRNSIGIELNPEYIKMIEHRLEHWHKPAPPPLAKPSVDMPLFQAQEPVLDDVGAAA